MKTIFYSVLTIFPVFITTVTCAQDLPIDTGATKETINLYKKLKQLPASGKFLFGHQDATAYGVGWKDTPDKSDIKDLIGDHPALLGWDLAGIEKNDSVNITGVSFKAVRQYTLQSFERGEVVTFSWHLPNPLTGKPAWNPSPGTVAFILPGGEKNELYKRWLDKVAVFLLSLRNREGIYIPVILRPFHELNGNWFWWGGRNCTPTEFRQLWEFTVRYLRDYKNIHHLLYAFNTDRFGSEKEYMEKYPGDEWVDIVGMDLYQKPGRTDASFAKLLDSNLTMLDSIASRQNKIHALTEFGFNQLSSDNWWTQVFLKVARSHRLAYAMAWRNSGSTEYYVPYPGQRSAEDFKSFSKTGIALFSQQAGLMKIYQSN